MKKSHLAKDFLSISACPFGPPRCPGVYGIFVWDREKNKKILMYIGSSKNVHARILNSKHPYRILYNESTWDKLVYSITMETDDFVSIEKILIKELKPKLNIQHKYGKEIHID